MAVSQTGESPNVFDGLRMLDVTIFGVGAMTTRFLCDHGAECIRFESRAHPDAIRSYPPFADGTPGLDRSAYWAEYNQGRLGVTLNFAQPEGKELFKQLVAVSDVVCENFVHGTLEKWGLAYDDLAAINPRIIMIRLNMQGHSGPKGAHRGAGNTLQALSGFNELTGWADRAALGTGGPYTDFCVPGVAASALLAALDYRERTGRGQYIDVAQLEVALHFIAPAMLEYAVNDDVVRRNGNADHLAAPHAVFPAAGDDRWIAIAIETDEQWIALRRVWTAPLDDEAVMATREGRHANAGAIEHALAQWTATEDAFDLMHRLQHEGVPAAAVQHGGDLLSDPQLAFRKHYVKLEHPVIGWHSYEAPSFILSKTPGAPQRPAPMFGQHNRDVFQGILGVSDADFSRLEAEKVIY